MNNLKKMVRLACVVALIAVTAKVMARFPPTDYPQPKPTSETPNK